MNSAQQSKAVQRIATQVIEEIGADAVVIMFSKVRGNATTTHLHTWGNMLTCRGLAEEAYGILCEADSLDDEETEDV